MSSLSVHLSRLRVGQYFAICRSVFVRQCVWWPSVISPFFLCDQPESLAQLLILYKIFTLSRNSTLDFDCISIFNHNLYLNFIFMLRFKSNLHFQYHFTFDFISIFVFHSISISFLDFNNIFDFNSTFNFNLILIFQLVFHFHLRLK